MSTLTRDGGTAAPAPSPSGAPEDVGGRALSERGPGESTSDSGSGRSESETETPSALDGGSTTAALTVGLGGGRKLASASTLTVGLGGPSELGQGGASELALVSTLTVRLSGSRGLGFERGGSAGRGLPHIWQN
ncbi:hypothetical protein N9L68_02365 [bacterium]|nr:hypothetical protein [bacterium]